MIEYYNMYTNLASQPAKGAESKSIVKNSYEPPTKKKNPKTILYTDDGSEALLASCLNRK